jgi:acetaldehyde dehydrogenase (acetylating)
MKSISRAQQTPHIEVQVPKGVNQLGASLVLEVRGTESLLPDYFGALEIP